MRTAAAIAVCIGLSLTGTQLAIAADQPQAASTASAQPAAAPGDELHFVTVLALHGQVVAVHAAKPRLSLKRANGETSTLEARSEKDLQALKPGDRVAVRYFEGAQIRKRKPAETVPLPSLNDGIIVAELGEPAGKPHTFVASVQSIDAANEEVTVKGTDGSLETIMVANPEYLEQVKVGDQIVIRRAQALALSIEKES